MSDSPNERALQEFLSEAQEIIDTYSKNLLALDAGRAEGRFDPEVLNDAFRAVHSLKGLSGLFGLGKMTHVSHNLENLLDSLRLGRVELKPETLDLLFEAVVLFQRIVAEAAGHVTPGEPPVDALVLDDFVARLDVAAQKREAPGEGAPWGGFELDPGLLAVLTEYEEHRLRENIKSGRALYRVHCAFDLLTIDKDLEQLKARLKPIGEVITYLPSADSASESKIELDVILGSAAPIEEVKQAIESDACEVRAIPRRAAGAPPAAPSPAPSPVAATHTAHAPHAPAAAAVDDRALDDAAELSLRSIAQTVRVDIKKLDSLMNIVGELAIARAGLQTLYDQIKTDRAQQTLARALHEELRSFGRRLDELQAGILEVRMVPLGQVFDKLSRVVRKLSRDAKKEIRLQVSGAETELDKLIVEELSDPLMHVVRNCIDHGIEPAGARRERGKPEVGTLTIAAEQRGNHVVITIADDGAGLDEKKLVEKAVARGVLSPEEARELGRRDIWNLVFLPGISTKEVADHLSGRGVGMDVVKTNIARLSGIIDIDSEPGRGTRFTITLPITLAIIQALVVKATGRTYAIPLNSVLESLLMSANDVTTIERREVMTLRGQTLPLARLEKLFELSRRPEDEPPADQPRRHRQFVVVVGLAQHRVGLLVDELLGQQDIVVKPLGRALEGIPGVAGATELGGKKTVLVLDVAALVEEVVSGKREEAA